MRTTNTKNNHITKTKIINEIQHIKIHKNHTSVAKYIFIYY